MIQKLIFVGGPPGVGKTTTCTELGRLLPNSIWIDGDDLWCRMNPFRADDDTIPMVEKNIAAVLGNFLDAGFGHVMLCWVLHSRDVIDGLVERLSPRAFSFYSVTLICEEAVLRRRWALTHKDGFGVEHACRRLTQARELPGTALVDTTAMTAVEAATAIAGVVA